MPDDAAIYFAIQSVRAAIDDGRLRPSDVEHARRFLDAAFAGQEAEKLPTRAAELYAELRALVAVHAEVKKLLDRAALHREFPETHALDMFLDSDLPGDSLVPPGPLMLCPADPKACKYNTFFRATGQDLYCPVHKTRLIPSTRF